MHSDYQACRLCPRLCGVDRSAGRRGFCGETSVPRVAAVTLHRGEEPPLSGTNGSGAIFFSGCSCGCFFCQNHQISLSHQGTPMDIDDLEAAARRLIAQGAHNLNFVTPDHFWPHIRTLCRRLRESGADIPLLFNTSGYHRPEQVDAHAEWIDIFLPDFKFAEPALAQACMGDAGYPEMARTALRRMIAIKGFLNPWDPDGKTTARRGVLVRHLVLPGAVDNSLAVLRWLREEFGPELPLSVMSQFTPTPRSRAHSPGFSRTLRRDEYMRVCDEVESLGFEYVFLQPEMEDDGAFLPDFDKPQPFEGNLPP